MSTAVQLAKTCQDTRINTATLSTDQVIEVNKITHYQQKPKFHQRSPSPFLNQVKPANCPKCGQQHRFKCPAQGSQCRNCGKYNHYFRMCRSPKSVKQVTCVTENNKSFLGVISIVNSEQKPWTTNLSINNNNITFMIDTGADTNIISLSTFNKHIA